MTEQSTVRYVSIIKYDKPEQVSKTDKKQVADRDAHVFNGACGGDDILDETLIARCKEAARSQLDTEQLLNSIAPPREWEEEGKRYRQLLSNVPASRTDILDLNDAVNDQLTNRQARPDGICPIRRELADQAFDELIRQITLSQPERGLLLLRVRDELHMTLSAYQDLFVSSRDYDPYKNVLKESYQNYQEMEKKYKSLVETVKAMQEERDSMAKMLEREDLIFKESREAAFKKFSEEFHFLKRVNNVLKTHTEAMVDPANNVDPIIDAYVVKPYEKDKKDRQRKGKRDKCKDIANPV